MKALNRRGAVLGWVVILLTVITLLTGAALSASFGYYNHVVTRVSRQQAAFTARSAAGVITTSLGREPDDDNPVAVMLQRYPGAVIEIEGMDEAMGTCTAVSGYDDDGMLLVTVTARTGGISCSVTAGFQPIASKAPEAADEEGFMKWELAELREGEEYEQNP